MFIPIITFTYLIIIPLQGFKPGFYDEYGIPRKCVKCQHSDCQCKFNAGTLPVSDIFTNQLYLQSEFWVCTILSSLINTYYLHWIEVILDLRYHWTWFQKLSNCITNTSACSFIFNCISGYCFPSSYKQFPNVEYVKSEVVRGGRMSSKLLDENLAGTKPLLFFI